MMTMFRNARKPGLGRRWILGFVVGLVLAVGWIGCDRHTRDAGAAPEVAVQTDGDFQVHWPPRERVSPSVHPLLHGELLVAPSGAGRENVFQLQVVLRRPEGEDDRLRWNKHLAFPEYSWMAQVRVWSRDGKWLWPNLPYLLRAHGEERVDRYGGIDPGKGIDNDFAAVLIRPLDGKSMGQPSDDGGQLAEPLVSAEWVSGDRESADRESIVHVARSDVFRVNLPPQSAHAQSGRLGIWLIFADFLGEDPPRNWPIEKEYAGGILAYFEVDWQRRSDGEFEFGIKHLAPPTATGFNWAGWSTGDSALKKNLEMAIASENHK